MQFSFYSEPFPNKANKIKDWPNGWKETRQPIVHGRGNSKVRRFLKNDNLGGIEMWVETKYPLTLLGSFSCYSCIEYFDKKKGVYWLIEDNSVDYEDGVLLCRNVHEIPRDAELEKLFDGKSTGQILSDVYGTVCILYRVYDGCHAFKVAEAMAKRAKRFARKR